MNVSDSMSFQACIEDIVNGVADELSPTPALPHGVRADTSVFTPWKHCAIKGCRWVYHGHAATSSNEGHQRLAKHLEEAHADLFHKYDDKVGEPPPVRMYVRMSVSNMLLVV